MKGGYEGLTCFGDIPNKAVELVVGDNTNNGGGYAAGKCPVIPLHKVGLLSSVEK